MDAAYHQRTANIGKKELEGDACFWCKSRDASTKGLCSKCNLKLSRGTLILPDFGKRNKDEIINLISRFQAIAKSADVSAGELLVAAMITAIKMGE